MSEPERVLVLSVSARALAGSATRGGFVPLACDLFADLDTRAACAEARAVRSGRHAFDEDALDAALDALDPAAALAVVNGSGFDAAPAQLDRIAARRRLLGNPGGVVARVKHPARLAAVLAKLGIPCPETRRELPADVRGWLRKRAGGAGGGHVRPASPDDTTGDGVFFQRHVAGLPVSATLLSDGRATHVLGLTELLFETGVDGKPFLYGGGIALPADQLPAAVTADIERAGRALAAECGLVGLWGMDMVIDAGRWWLLEVNPRPSASFELHEGTDSLFAAHVAACRGTLRDVPARAAELHGQRIVYATAALRAQRVVQWPAWLRDRPCPGTDIGVGQPICSVHARGASVAEVRERLAGRAAEALRLAAGWREAAA